MDDQPTAPPGWYPRPGGGQRFWNGERWNAGVTGNSVVPPAIAYPTQPGLVPYSAPSQPSQYRPPGWYQNNQGHMQWWDGFAWGQIAQPTYIAQRLVTKSAGIAYLLWFFLGGFAAHRFYLRRTLSAVIFLAVWWGGWATISFGFGIFLVAAGAVWLFADLFLIPGMARTTSA